MSAVENYPSEPADVDTARYQAETASDNANGAVEAFVEVPVTFRVIEGLSGVSRVVGLDPAMCALFDDAPPRCWGQNTEWGLLSRTLAPSFATPTAREGLGVAVSISAGANHACAAERDGTLMTTGF